MKILLVLVLLAFGVSAKAQVAINTDGSTPDNSAMLDVKSTSKGVLIPRMSQTQRNAIVNPATGLMVFQTDNPPGYYYNAGTSAAPVWARVGMLELPFNGTINYMFPAFSVTNLGAATGIFGEGYYGIYGRSIGSSGVGVVGWAESSSGTATGVWGNSYADEGIGVWGSGRTGVYGTASFENCYGVLGKNSGSSGVTFGVRGEAISASGVGVEGLVTSTSGATIGVLGTSLSSSGYGVRGVASATSGTNFGVFGRTFSEDGYSGYFMGGNFYVSGNVGIGDIYPEYRLVIRAPDVTSTGILACMNAVGENKVVLRQNSNGSGAVNIYEAGNTTNISLVGEGNSYINGGNLGIGTSSPAYKLQVGVAGDGTQARANAWNLFSDVRLKKDISPIHESLDKVLKIHGYYYHWKTGSDQSMQVGFSAQEVREVMPEVVSEGSDGYLSIEYGKMTPLLLEAIKELKAENNQLKNRILEIEMLLSNITGNN